MLHVEQVVVLVAVISRRLPVVQLDSTLFDVSYRLNEAGSLAPTLLAVFIEGFLTLDDAVGQHIDMITFCTSQNAPHTAATTRIAHTNRTSVIRQALPSFTMSGSGSPSHISFICFFVMALEWMGL